MSINFERSPDTDAVIAVLRGVNHEISYTDIARRADLGVKRMKSVIHSARRVLAKDGIIFGTIVNQGLKRLTDKDKVKKPEAFKRRVMKGAGRELKHLSTISDFSALSKTDQHSVTIHRTTLNAIRQSAAVNPDKPEPKVTPLPLPNVSVLTAKK